MVAVISGSGLGLFGSSVSALGGVGGTGNAAPGRGNDRIYVNTATGNLVVQSVDESLAALGLDVSLVRTYNSQGLMDDDNGDNWRLGVHQRLYNLTGTVNTAGSRITKVFGDGREVAYEFDAALGAYVSTEGEGAHDTLTFASNSWVWEEGSSHVQETYDENGRLTSSRDADENDVTYHYTGSLLTRIDDASGQSTHLDYTGNNLAGIRVVSNGVTQTLTTYQYDGDSRLSSVTVDLTPENTADAQVYVTTYTYDGASRRIESITQTDGSSISFTYELVNGQYRVHTYTDALQRVTTFTYTSSGAAPQTANADPAELSTTRTETSTTTHDLDDNLVVPGAPVWGTPETTTSGTDSQLLYVQYDASGNAFELGYTSSGLSVRRYDAATATWSAWETLINTPVELDQVPLAMDDAGNAVLAWVDDADVVHMRRYSSTTGQWGPSEVLDATAGPKSLHSVTVNNGHVAVAWTEDAETDAVLMAALSTASGIVIEQINNSASIPFISLSVDASGNATAVWAAASGLCARQFSSAAGTWSATQLAAPAAQPMVIPYMGRVGRAANGDTLLVFIQLVFNPLAGTFGYQWRSSTYSAASASWSQSTLLPAHSQNSFVEFDAQGNALLVGFIEGAQPGISLTLYDAGSGTWGSPKTVAFTAEQTDGMSAMAVDLRGDSACVTWPDAATGHLNIVTVTDGGPAVLTQQQVATGSSAYPTGISVAPDGSMDLTWIREETVGEELVVTRTHQRFEPAASYSVPAGATWQSLANTLYGVNSAAAGAALQLALGNPTLSTGLQLTGLPATLAVESSTVETVPAYYTVQQGDTWASIANSIYGTTDPSAIAALQQQLGNPPLTAGAELTVPQTLSYGTQAGVSTVDVTDPAGVVTRYEQDEEGRLVAVTTATDTLALRTEYEYDGDGNVIGIVRDPDGLNRVTTMTYDERGNLLSRRDDLGNTLERTYSADNQLLTETVYQVRDPDGAGSATASVPLTTRYAYDGENHLRFTVSAEGRVTEHSYNSAGMRIATLTHLGATYAGSAFDTPTLESWAASQDSTQVRRIEYAYDFRGNVSVVSEHLASGDPWQTRFLYDQRGQLLQTIAARSGAGSTLDPANLNTPYSTTYSYDGFGRVLSVSRWNADGDVSTSLNLYDDPNRTTTVTLANGLVTTTVHDLAGQVISVARGDGMDPDSLGTTRYAYDAQGRLRMQTDPAGLRLFFEYDDAGRRVAQVDADGTLIELVHDDLGRVIKTIEYGTRLTPAMLASLVDGDERTSVGLADMRAIADDTPALDRINRSVYDAAGLLIYEIDATGAVTQYFYDGAGRVTDEVRYADEVGIPASVNEVLDGSFTLEPSPDDDRRVRHFYDADGLLRGTLDAAGYLVEFVYDAAGQLVHQIGYANRTDSSVWSTGTLADLRASAGVDEEASVDPEQDVHSYFFYDLQGHRTGVLDAEGYLTETTYLVGGLVDRQIRYGRPLSFTPGSTLESLRDAATASPAPTSRTTTFAYDGMGRVVLETNPEGTQTHYTYDSVGRLISTTRAFGTAEARTTQTRYDLLGRVLRELTAEGHEQLTSGMTPEQINDIWSRCGVTYAYDDSGRRISATVRPNDAQTNTTLYFYDEDGRLRFEVNPNGEVVERRYDAFGGLTDTIAYADPISTADLIGGLVNTTLLDRISGVNGVADAARDAHTSMTYTLRGQVESVLSAESALTSYTYNAFGEERLRTQQLTGATSLVQERTYDRRGLLTNTVWDASGVNKTEQRSYDAFGRTATITDGNGNVSEFHYDRLGREIATFDGLNIERATTYDAFGRVLRTRDGLQHETVYTYDDVTRSIVVTTPGNVTVTTIHNRHGQTLRVIAAGNTTDYQYDANGALTGISDQLGMLEGRAYDRAGRQIAALDARGITTTFAYDAANRLLTRTEDDGGLALTTIYEYDTQGRVVWVTEPNGTRTRTDYDRDGRVVETAVDPTGLNIRTTYAYDLASRNIRVTVGAGNAYERVTTYAYDALGRRISETVDPGSGANPATGQLYLDLLTEYRYDDNGNVTRKIDANLNSTWYVYDAANRLTHVIDALGGVTRTAYDEEGRIVLTERYATALTAGTLAALGDVVDSGDFSVAVSELDRRSQSIYDRDGREIYSLDAMGGVTERTFDENGNVTRRRLYVHPVTSAIYETRDELEQALTAAGNSLDTLGAQDRVQWTAYDLRGRAVFAVDGAGAVTRNEYDANGNVTATTAYATLRSTTASTDLAALNSWAAAQVTDAHNRTTQYWYDAVDRLRFTRDAQGYLTEMRYEDTSRREIQKVYASPAPSLTGATLAQVISAAGNLENTSVDQTTITQLDAAGRKQRITDAVGNYEEFQYDDVGNKISYRNQAGAVWNYEYDANGRLTYERSPAVRVTNIVASGNSLSIDSNSSDLSIVTHLEYDALGNVRFRTEAHGTSQARTTEYVYDKLGRQIRTNFPTANVYYADQGDTALGNGSAIARTEQSTALYSTVAYDTLGNAFRSQDVGGGFSYKTYDNLGRVEYEVDAEGYATRYTYDAFGNEQTLTRYAGELTGSLPQASDNLTSETVSQLIEEQAGQDRVIVHEYDRLNRVTKVTQLAVFSFVPSAGGGGASFSAAPTTVYEYNAFGDVVRSRELVNSQAGSYADTYFYYDRRGLKTAEVNALRYLTEYAYDETGDLQRQVEYARPLESTPTLQGYGTPPITTPQTHPDGIPEGYDRDTVYTYDRLNRKVSETKVGIRYSTIVAGVPTMATGDQLTTFGYDAVGNQTRVSQIGVDVNGTATDTHIYTYYDVLGRAIAVAEPARALGNGTTLAPLTYMYRDAFGNLVGETRFANGADGVPTAATLAVPDQPDLARDRTTLMLLDKYGRAIQTQDATGANRFASYNARGEVAKEWQAVTNEGTTEYLTTIYKYDALGQQTHVIEPQRYSGGTTIQSTRKTEYNAFGEVTFKGLIDAAHPNGRQEFFHYDQAGRLWRTNTGDGVTKVYLHDLAGRVTAEIRSQGRDLASATYANAEAVHALTSDVMRTETRYDALGRALEQRSPAFESSDGVEAIAASFDIATGVAGPLNPFAIYRLVTVDYGTGPFQMYVVDPTATLAQGGGYYIDELGRYVQDPNHQIVSSVRITWAAPSDASVQPKFEYRLLGSTDPNAWATIAVGALADNKLGVDVASLAGQQYEYRVTYRRSSETSPYAQATGSFQVQGTSSSTVSISQSPADPAASIPALGSYANGVMSWAAPSDSNVSATVRVRREGQENFVDVEATRQGGNFNADLVDELAQAGNYRYEILYTRTVNGAQVVVAKNSGQLYSSGMSTPRTVEEGYSDDYTYVQPPVSVPPVTTQAGSSIGAVIVGTEEHWLPPETPLPPANPNVHQVQNVQWRGQNTLQLAWANLGSGNYQVEVDYVSEDFRRWEWVAQDVAWQPVDYSGSATTTGRVAASATGATINWSSASGDTTGGVESVSAVRVYKETSPGVWTMQLQVSNPTAVFGRGLTWDAPDVSYVDEVTFEYALPNTSNFTPVPVTPSGDKLAVDLTNVPANTYTYRISYRIDGRLSAQQVGTLFIQDAHTSTGTNVTVTPGFPREPAPAVSTITSIPGSSNAVVYSFDGADLIQGIQPNGEPRWRWTGNNTVTVNYTSLPAQDFIAQIEYVPLYNPGGLTFSHTSSVYSSASYPSSVTVVWSGATDWDNNQTPPGGIWSVSRVRLLGRDGSGNFTVVLRDTASAPSGARLRWLDPHPTTTVTADYWNGSSWQPLTLLRTTGYLYADLGNLNGTYSYRIRHVRNGETFATSVSEGTFTASNGTATVNSQNNVVTSTLSGVTANGMTVQWTQAPESGDTVTFEYFYAGAWHTNYLPPSGTYSFTMPVLPQGQYQYRIKYTRANKMDAYRYAEGVLNVTNTTVNIPPMVTMTQTSNQTYPQTAITTVQIDGDTLSWNYPKQGYRVVLRYSLNHSYHVVELAGSGPNYSFTFSDAVADGQHQVFYDIEYLYGTETSPRAFASGMFYFGVSYPEIPPAITINSQVPEYPSGMQNIAAPAPAGGNVISWGTPAEADASVIFRYRSAAGGRWTELQVQGNYSVDLTTVAATAAGTAYFYEILYQRAGEQNPYARGAGTFTLTRNTNVTGFSITPVPASQPALVEYTPTQTQLLDRWGNAISVTDAASNTTDYRYNHLDQVVRVESPEVLVTSTTNRLVDEERRRVVSRNYYDALGRLVATQDANGNINRSALNAAGQIVAETHADGGTRTHHYNVFGEVTATQIAVTAGNFYETRYAYDLAGRLQSVSREVTANAFETNDTNNIVVDSYTYDAAGRRITETNGENETVRYYYDLHDNLVRRRSPQNLDTHYEYDAQGNKTREENGLGDEMTWAYDYFNRLDSHVNLAGTIYTYSYTGDFAGLMQSQSSSAGQAMTFSYDAAGHLTRIDDTGVDRITDYSYDGAGRRSREKVRIAGLTYQDTMIGYDEMNRISSLSDLRYNLTYSYDAQGNRTHIAATYYDHERDEQHQDLWYTYDAMNRVLISQGENVFGQVDISEGHGVRLTYDLAGRRITSESYGKQKIYTEDVSLWDPQRQEMIDHNKRELVEDLVLERYEYDGLDRLTHTWREGEQFFYVRNDWNEVVENRRVQTEFLVSRRWYDKASREIKETTKSVESNELIDRERTSVYDDDGRLTSQTTLQADPLNVIFNLQTESIVTYDYDDANRMLGYHVQVHRGGSSPAHMYTSHYTNHFRFGEGYLDGGQSVYSQAVAGTQVPESGQVIRNYNVNGELISVVDVEKAERNRYFANGADGQALLVVQGDISTPSSAFANALARADNSNRSQYFFFANGQAVGSFGQLQNEAGDFEANFDVNHTPISSRYPASTPASTIAKAGDTLRTIAARVFGDASLWYVLADENGLTDPDAVLTEGTLIQVPNEVVALSNAAGSFKPFDASDAIGDTTPTQPLPPPPKKKGCGVLGQILVIVVAIVVSVVSYGVLSKEMSALAAAVLSSAAGSVVSQGVAIATGQQESFSWKSVAAAAITGGLTRGIPTFGGQIVDAAINNAVGQGVNIALGLQDSFNWSSVAAAAVAAPISSWAGEKVGNAVGGAFENAAIGRAAGALTGNLVGQVVYTQFNGGKIDYVQLAADVFGNALGNSIVHKLTSPTTAQSDEIGLTDEQYANMNRQVEAEYLAGQSGFNDQLRQDIRQQKLQTSLQTSIERGLSNNPDFVVDVPMPAPAIQTEEFPGVWPAAPAESTGVVTVYTGAIPPPADLHRAIADLGEKSAIARDQLEHAGKLKISVQFGKSGGGSSYDPYKRLITLDGNLQDNALDVQQTLSHEIGHALDPRLAEPLEYKTADEYVRAALADEGLAEINREVIRREIVGAGKQAFDPMFPRKSDQALLTKGVNAFYQDGGLNGPNVNKAAEEIGAKLMSRGKPTGYTDITYEDLHRAVYAAVKETGGIGWKPVFTRQLKWFAQSNRVHAQVVTQINRDAGRMRPVVQPPKVEFGE